MEKEKEMTKIAFMMAETIITGSIIMNKGLVHKNLPYIQNITEKDLRVVSAYFGKNINKHDVDLFNDILCNVLEKRLYWYCAEGFSEEKDDSYKFLKKTEIENEDVYGQD